MALAPYAGTGRNRRLPVGLRWALVCVSALMLSLIAAGCSASPPPTTNLNGAWTVRTVDHGQISLSVPANWNIGQAWTMPSSFTDLVGSFSNQELLTPCSTSANSVECGPPMTSFQPGGVLVEVFQNGFPGWTINTQPGTATTVSGLAARVAFQTGGQSSCRPLGADRSTDEVIALPNAPDNYFEVTICSRGVAGAVTARIIASVEATPSS
jgi:hypothetical protein